MKHLISLAVIALCGFSTIPAFAQRCFSPEAFHAPQPILSKEPLIIVSQDGQAHNFSVEMALTPGQQETGLMERRSLPADGGMLFDMGLPPQGSHFWMCNTVLPLDMVFIKPEGTIDSVAENAVPFSVNEERSQGPVRATLELPSGTAARLGIRAGDTVRQRIFGNAG